MADFPIMAKIKDRQMIADGILMVTFDLQGKKVDFKPGHFFYITLQNPPYQDERGPKRHFSIVSSPAETNVLAFATKLRPSAFKKSIQELPIGTEVVIPMTAGRSVLPEDPSTPLIYLAGGIGINPFRSAIKHVSEQKLPYKITLLYSNRDQKSTAFLEELKNISKENPNIKVVFTMTQDESWDGEKGRINVDFIKKYVENPQECMFYIAGPAPMVEALYQAVSAMGAPEERIKKETFTGY